MMEMTTTSTRRERPNLRRLVEQAGGLRPFARSIGRDGSWIHARLVGRSVLSLDHALLIAQGLRDAGVSATVVDVLADDEEVVRTVLAFTARVAAARLSP